MKLSDVPLRELRSDADWVTSATGKKGRIYEIWSAHKGNGFVVKLHIIWEDKYSSFPEYPNECGYITVEEPTEKLLAPYIEDQITQLEKQKEYYEFCRPV